VPTRNPHRHGLRLTIASLLVASLGCETLVRVIGFGKQAEMARQTALIDGRIDVEGASSGTLVIVLGRVPEEPDAPLVGIDSFVRERPGAFRFAVPAGRYRLGAYEDRNGNGVLDLDERVSILLDNPILEVAAGERVSHDLLLRTGSRLPDSFTEPVDVLALVERTPAEQRHFSLWALSVQGELVEDLDDPKFGPDAGRRGLWEIMDFLTEGIAGVYFMEPYDPERIPVLFVHGISGYPQEFSTLIEKLDRERFQAWFYFYPSGFSLDGISSHLATLLERLQIQYRYDEIAVVAHSMGGLVSRGAILKYYASTGRDDVPLFVSISTPWGGDVEAERTENSRIELPLSFKDMDPRSDYLRWVFHDGDAMRRLPPSTRYHMLFGFRMTGSNSVANDGTVSVASQTRAEAQEVAVSERAPAIAAPMHMPIEAISSSPWIATPPAGGSSRIIACRIGEAGVIG